MDEILEKIYVGSGLILIILALVNLFAEVGQIRHVYIFMCIGMFIFFDSLNYFLVDKETLISRDVSLLSGGLFILLFGSIGAFMFEVYGAYLTGIWSGVFFQPVLEGMGIEIINQLVDTVFLYGILALPAYSIYRILCEVFETETMLKNEFGASDYYRYFVHSGILLLAAPFILIFVDLNLNIAYLFFVASLIGLLMIIEYFEFRKKGQGTIANLAYGQYDRFGAVMGVTVTLGFLIALTAYNKGFWTAEVPFEELQLLGTPVSIFVIWTLVVMVVSSGLNLISSTELPNFRPEKEQDPTESEN